MIFTIIKYFVFFALGIALFAQYYFSQTFVNTLSYQEEIISIYRDQNNIPRIQSKTHQGTVYALGYVMAQDRLFQMHFKRRIANGRLSQILGKASISVDRMFRQINFIYWTKLIVQKIKQEDPEIIKIYEAFCKGINDYVHSNHLPLEFYLFWINFEDWTIQDTIILGKLLQWSQATDYFRQFARSQLLNNHTKQQVDNIIPYTDQKYILPEYILSDDQLKAIGYYQQFNLQESLKIKFIPQKIHQVGDLGIVDYLLNAKDGKGSNSWVISGNLTASGRPILAADPHLDNVIPSQWYLASIRYTSKKDVQISAHIAFMTGTLFGIGKTNYFSFGCTNTYIDNQDLYKQKVRDDEYLYNQKWLKLKSREEIIKVRGSEDEKILIRQTHRGPLVSRILFGQKMYEIKEDLSLVWGSFNTEIYLYTKFIKFMQVGSLQELDELYAIVNSAPSLNNLFITKDDHIGLYAFGTYPIRRNHLSGAYIKDGTTNEHDWIGFLKGSQKPHILDPEKGFIVSANNKLASENFKGGFFKMGGQMTGRGSRINQLIRNKIQKGHKFTVQDSIDIQLDTTDCYCVHILPKILQLFPKLTQYLNDWDCNLTKESYQASIYSLFFYNFQERLHSGQYSFEGSHTFNHYTYRLILDMNHGDQKIELMNQSFKQTMDYLNYYFQSEDIKVWQWGKLHYDHLPHVPLGKTFLAPFFDLYAEGSGNENTPQAGVMKQVSKDNYNIIHKANIRLIAVYGQNQSIWISDSGQSSNIFSKHYSDQFELISNGKYLPMQRSLNDEVTGSQL